MHGLRFDSSRETTLVRSVPGPLGEYTFSCWIKPTSFNNWQRIFVIDTPVYSQVALDTDGYIRYGDTLTFYGISTKALKLNTWNSLVVKVTSTEVFFYINNEDVSPGGITPIDYSGQSNLTFRVGKDTDDTSILNGYLSDFYFVDAALEPTVFGKDFPEGWGPLDGSVVETNIANSKVQPYDTRPNMDEKWSASGSDPDSTITSGSIAEVFDGDLTTGIFFARSDIGTEKYVVLTEDTIECNEQVAFYTVRGASTLYAKINGTPYEINTIETNDVPHWATVDFTGTINKLEIAYVGGSGSSSNCKGVSIDGRILVDGPADNSQVWSDGWNTTQINDPTNAFDVSDTTYAQSAINNPQDIGFAFEPPFNTSTTGDAVNIVVSATTDMTVWFGKNGEITSANTNAAQMENVSTTPTTITIPSAGSNISSIEFGQKSGIGAIRIHSVRIGDTILVDGQDLGPYNKLYEPWSTWVSNTTRALLEASESRVDALEQTILAMAIPWSYGSTYSAGDLVKFNCSVWRATSNGITTRTPIPTNSDVWENLYIDCERTNTMDDLIPDDWSAEQRRAALQELLLELSEDEPEGY